MHERHIHVFASDRAEPLNVALTGDQGLNITVVTDGTSFQVEVAASASQHYPGDTAQAERESCVGESP
jgi:hypothetical protein